MGIKRFWGGGLQRQAGVPQRSISLSACLDSCLLLALNALELESEWEREGERRILSKGSHFLKDTSQCR